MTPKIFSISVILALLLVSAAAYEGDLNVAVYVTRLGGDSATAAPYMERFLRYVESATGRASGSMKGAFLVTRKDATAFIDGSEPGIGMLDPPLYFELSKAKQLKPIAQVESADLVSSRLNLVVKDPAVKTVSDLKGKRLWTTLADYPNYLSRIVFGGQVDAASHFSLKQVGQALRGARGVLRGDCDAAILDDGQLADAKQMSGGADLRTLVSTPALLPIPVVVFGGALSTKDQDTLVKALTSMCGSDKGSAVCKEMHIDKFVPVNTALFTDAAKRYGE